MQLEACILGGPHVQYHDAANPAAAAEDVQVSARLALEFPRVQLRSAKGRT